MCDETKMKKTCSCCGKRYGVKKDEDWLDLGLEKCPTCKALPEKGTFTTKVVDGKMICNTYDCDHCKKAGKEHEVVDVPHGFTTGRSQWGPGIATTRQECTCCGRWSGPWVSADIVGGGW